MITVYEMDNPDLLIEKVAVRLWRKDIDGNTLAELVDIAAGVLAVETSYSLWLESAMESRLQSVRNASDRDLAEFVRFLVDTAKFNQMSVQDVMIEAQSYRPRFSPNEDTRH